VNAFATCATRIRGRRWPARARPPTAGSSPARWSGCYGASWAACGQQYYAGGVATNAKLTKVQANKLAQFASLGMARTIYPVNTMADGDTPLAVDWRPRGGYQCAGSGSSGSAGQGYRARVRFAKTLGGVPGLG